MHSSFDVEVYAKAVRDDFRREAELARRVNEALGGQQVRRSTVDFNLKRLLSDARAWLLAGRREGTAPPADVAADPANFSLIVAPAEPRAAPGVRPNHSAEPYAGMVVIARGKPLQTLEEPSGARER